MNGCNNRVIIVRKAMPYNKCTQYVNTPFKAKQYPMESNNNLSFDKKYHAYIAPNIYKGTYRPGLIGYCLKHT